MTGAGLKIIGLKSPLAGPFDLEVRAGACLAITGASGAGKSLFLRMIADLDPHEGEVWLGDQARAALTGPQWRQHVIYVAAESGWWSDAVADHFAPEYRKPAQALAERLGLAPELLEAKVARLSTGERQRLALVRALVRRAPALLLDEPTASLDHASVAKVEAVLAERLAEGLILVMVTHDPAQAERLGTVRMTMSSGKLGAA